MTHTTPPDSGKGHRDENFPVASWLVRPDARAPILAYYRFARAADDVADTLSISADQRLALLNQMDATLTGVAQPPETRSAALAQILAERGLVAAHARDLLIAFRRDCVVHRTPDWAALMDYCRYSAMPVGRFVLDVHGEDQALWPASDALCAALQIINHLQDCGKDYRQLGRIYLPTDLMNKAGLAEEDLAAGQAKPALRLVLRECAQRTDALLLASRPLPGAIRDRRLGMEIAVIHRLATSLNHRLKHRDPLSQRVHHRKVEALGLALLAVGARAMGQ